MLVARPAGFSRTERGKLRTQTPSVSRFPSRKVKPESPPFFVGYVDVQACEFDACYRRGARIPRGACHRGDEQQRHRQLRWRIVGASTDSDPLSRSLAGAATQSSDASPGRQARARSRRPRAVYRGARWGHSTNRCVNVRQCSGNRRIATTSPGNAVCYTRRASLWRGAVLVARPRRLLVSGKRELNP